MSWQASPLGVIADTQLGKMLDAKKNDGEYRPYLGNDNVQWDGIDLSEVKEMRFKDSELPKFALKTGDLLVCEGGDPGRCAIWNSDEEMYYQKALHRVRAQENVLDNRFLYYYLVYICSTQEIRQYYTGGATIKHLPKAALERVIVRYPDLETQRRIAGVLSAYDGLIGNNRKQIKLLEEAAQRLYKEWFVDLKFPGHETTAILNGLPKGWRQACVDELCDTIGGGTPSTKHSEYYEKGTIPWVTPSDISGNMGLYLPRTSRTITTEGLKNSSARLIPAKSILMTSRATIGAFAICTRDVCTNQGFISCVPHKAHIAWWLLRNLQARVMEIKGLAKGSTFLELSKSVFRQLALVVPDENTLKLFSSFSEALFEQEVIARKRIESAREARNRLLPKLMSGEIEV